MSGLAAGPLFGGDAGDPAIRTEFGPEAFLRRAIAFERAWTLALVETGLVEDAIGCEALRRIDGFDRPPAGLAEKAMVDGMGVPALVKALREGQPEAIAEAIHTGSTSQDVLDTALAITALAVVDRLEDRLGAVLRALDGLLEEFGDRGLMGRTRMQDALPITVGDRVGTWRRIVLGHLEGLPAIRSRIGRVQIGGPVGCRDMPEGERMAAAVAQTLGLEAVPCWHSDRRPIADFGHALASIGGGAAKVGTDLALMAQMGDLALSAGGGSSAMPHKRNPVRAELAVATGRYAMGLQGVLIGALQHEQERSGAMWTLEWLVLPTLAEAAGASLIHLAEALGGIEKMGR